MKKNILRIALYCSIVYTAGALELTVPEFNFGVSAGKQPTAEKISIAQEASVNFRLLHGERFYSDLGTALYIPDIIRFFYPQQQARSFGQCAFTHFSLNFLQLGGRSVRLSFFTGSHPSLTGARYNFEFLKYGIRPVRMHDNELAGSFLPPDAQENVGISFAGRVSNTVYLGGSVGWNAQLKDEQEYGVYMQGGSFSNTVLTNTYASVHITDMAKEISLDTALSLLFAIHNNFSIFMQTGLHKTNLRTPALKTALTDNMFIFFEPRVHTVHMNFDFTFFASKRNNRYAPFPMLPLLKPVGTAYNGLYGGLNIFCGFGTMEADKMQGGFHFLAATNIKNIKDTSALLLAATPFFTVNIGPCDFDVRLFVYPLAYTTPLSMFEGKVALKRNL